MSIDTSGKWWKGSEPSDMEEYLEAYSSDGGCPTEEYAFAKCSCGSVEFELEADDNEGCAKRFCAKCKKEHFICDSEEYWEDAEPERWGCIGCGSHSTNIGVGFALYPEEKEIKWLYVGVRCIKCGILGCFAGWKVGYAPSRQLVGDV